MDDTFSPPDFYRVILERWPRLILWAILGGLLLWAYGQAAPRRFRSSASVNVDQNAEAVVPIGDESGMASYLNRETLRLETLAFSDEVWQDVARALAQEGFLRRTEDLDRIMNDVRLPHPMDGEWRFTAYADDPALAARAAQLWAEAFVRHADQAVRIAREEEAVREAVADTAQTLSRYESQCVELRGLRGIVAQTSSRLAGLPEMAPPDPEALEELRWAAYDILACRSFRGCTAPQTVSDQRAFADELSDRLGDRLDTCLILRDDYREFLNADTSRWGALVEESLGVSSFMEVALLRDARPPTEPVVQDGCLIAGGALAGFAAWVAWTFLGRKIVTG